MPRVLECVALALAAAVLVPLSAHAGVIIPVPEPATFAVLGVGVAGLAYVKFRR